MKRAWEWLIAILGAAAAILVAVLTYGRRKEKEGETIGGLESDRQGMSVKIRMPSGRVYELVNESNKPDCIGILRRIESGDSSNSNAPVYHWPDR